MKPIKVLQKAPKFEESLCRIGEDWTVSDDVLRGIEHFVCYVYGYPRIKSVNALRLHLLRRKCEKNGKLDPKKNVYLANLPPCFSSLVEHIKRSNYQVKIWREAAENFPEIESPTLHGWAFGVCGLEPVWTDKPILPTQIVALLGDNSEKDSEEEDNLGVYESDSSHFSDSD